eukprot:m.26707 g.26707  ORF g.26707 m.26707 type:complete len:197 (-) comp7826_c0_seq1:248-838(-)
MTPTQTFSTLDTALRCYGWLWRKQRGGKMVCSGRLLVINEICLLIESLYKRAAKAFRRSVTVATDPIYGGAFRGLSSAQQHSFLIDQDCKLKWVQDEVMVGCMLMLENFNGKDVLDEEDKAWGLRTLLEYKAYTEKHFELKKYGFPYVLVGGDRQVTFRENYVNCGQPVAGNRKENYHHPRALMLMIELSNQILTS